MKLVKKIRKPIEVNSKYLNKNEKFLKKLKTNKIENVIRISLTKNNTKLTLLNKKGNIKISTTKGALLDFKGHEQRLPMAAMTLSEQFGKLIIEKKKIKKPYKVRLLITGSRRKKRVVVRGLKSSGIQIKSITNILKKKFNGCTPKKTRRL